MVAMQSTLTLDEGSNLTYCERLRFNHLNRDAQSYARQQAEQNQESSGDDGKRQRKRPKKETCDEAGLYRVHPLKLVLHIYDDETPDPKSHKLVMLTFEYLLKLNLVCVGIEESQEDILCDLFPDDAGLEPPHQSTKLILGDDHAFDESRTSRPYKWAQHLAGIEVLPEMSPFVTGKDTQNSDTASVSDHYSVQTILRRLRPSDEACDWTEMGWLKRDITCEEVWPRRGAPRLRTKS
ncbi:hypothetical protein DY000_02058677 [Brassica cretica]|uniref:Uncharacterized protein n=1 Tax=Brassica cretica TaxID=69181 RepID=A0ABQ7AU63_BRACR|nr:hypothetical protein DY000_02058677 [Brassica cretica]